MVTIRWMGAIVNWLGVWSKYLNAFAQPIDGVEATCQRSKNHFFSRGFDVPPRSTSSTCVHICTMSDSNLLFTHAYIYIYMFVYVYWVWDEHLSILKRPTRREVRRETVTMSGSGTMSSSSARLIDPYNSHAVTLLRRRQREPENWLDRERARWTRTRAQSTMAHAFLTENWRDLELTKSQTLVVGARVSTGEHFESTILTRVEGDDRDRQFTFQQLLLRWRVVNVWSAEAVHIRVQTPGWELSCRLE